MDKGKINKVTGKACSFLLDKAISSSEWQVASLRYLYVGGVL
jgi:hypothetical protein